MKNSNSCEKKRNSIEKIKPSSKETLFKRKKLTVWKKNNRFEKKILITKNKTPFTLNEKKKPNPYFLKKKICKNTLKKQQLQKTMERKPNFKANLSLEKLLKQNSKLQSKSTFERKPSSLTENPIYLKPLQRNSHFKNKIFFSE